MVQGTRALIADDHSLYRRGLSRLLSDQFGFSEVFEASNLTEARAVMDAQEHFDLALFDLLMPGMAGATSLASLRLSHPKMKIAIVAASERRDDVLAAISIGLSGFIPKSLPSTEFTTAIEAILAGRIYVPDLMMGPQSLVASLPAATSARASPLADLSNITLTPRQQSVLACLQSGMTNREIAASLGISMGTAKTHVATILSLLNIRDRKHIASAKDGAIAPI